HHYREMSDSKRERLDGFLHVAGLRSTPARRMLLSAMKAAGPITEEEIADRMGINVPDPATLYRNLNLLVEAGLVERHRFRGKMWYYSLHFPDEPRCSHAHFVCESCGKCECLNGTESLIGKLKLKGKRVSGIEIVVNGLCGKCIAK
ncbi:MAG: transcriptional repressor, partial [bacterium]